MDECKSMGIKVLGPDVNESNLKFTVNPEGNIRFGLGAKDDSTRTNSELEQIVQLSERLGLATSGNYRNFYLKDGRKYAHAINPITGYPVQKDILSATIIAHQCMLADAYATAFMTLGSRKARQL